MPPPDDLEPRVSALEQQVRDLNRRLGRSEENAAAARILAGGADRDVEQIRAEFRDLKGEVRDLKQAMSSGFTAMRADLVDQRERTDRGFAEVRGRLDATAAGQEQIVTLLTTLIDREGDER